MDNLNPSDPNYDFLANATEQCANRMQGIFQALRQGQQPPQGMSSQFLGHLGQQSIKTPEDFQRTYGQMQNRLKSYDDIINRLSQRGAGVVAPPYPPAQPGSTPPAGDLSARLYAVPGITVAAMQQEPACWRSYAGPDNAVHQLKPRLYAVTSDGQYEDHWFFEYDAGSDALEKCRQYEAYYDSNTEQRDSGMFPAIVWVIPDDKRRTNLKSGVAGCAELQHKELFLFVAPDELEPLIRKGAGEGGAP